MYRNLTPLDPACYGSLPALARPLVRWRREPFGCLAAFPDGHIAVFDNDAQALLANGADYDRCAPHLVAEMEVATDFHFSAPLMGWIELTRACNLRCPHCFIEGGVARSGELPTDRILRLLDEWAEMGVFSVILTGGEPTIHPDFLDILHHAHGLGFAVGIATNGMPVTERLLAQIPRDDVIISVSIDNMHGQGERRGISDFDYATRKLLMIKEAGFNTSVMTTTSSTNAGALQSTIEWAVANDISLRSVPFGAVGRGNLNPHLANGAADVEAAARFWIAEEEWERVRDPKLGLCAGKVLNFLLTMVYAMRRCMSGRGICYVTSNGDVFPCSTCAGNKVLCAGNISWSPFKDIWDGDWEIRGITWDSYTDTCRGCPISERKYFCTGRCPGSSYTLNRRFDGCGTTDFQMASVLRREELFKARIREEPAVPVAERRAQARATVAVDERAAV
jgi:radical SAM protein with 4Fe4S-binding SPASM domain